MSLKEQNFTSKKSASKVPAKSKTVNVEESSDYLKVSPLIYKHINTPQDMEILLSIYRRKHLSKTDIEALFQNYDTTRIYKFYRTLEKQRIQDNASFTLKNIKHILDRNIDDVQKGQSSDYLHLYTDTLNTMRLLELADNYIYRIKNNKELKEIHDDLAARYGAIRDAKKAEFYKKATKELSTINAIVGDVEITVNEVKKVKHELYSIISLHTGQTIERIAEDCQRDKWMTSTEAKEYGLIDEVLLINSRKLKKD